ncbi:hypothetical protein [Leptospira bandrabouensis]|uniref:hypothetical protein n=1 Tax=Leptospira bandrabouensis TaxID=2484903 RepID=UPI001EE8F004|nr:hypothetical protein [Leptospira bandrabouensis]MCG6146590.1 hypothetical protein [Leptospira bandrabouensis]MCG6161949.1 hypothetical protein [Leptospira bandrabouensis]MCG6166158.1 hypothetical protein [Leptospira bandrabouensis]
MSDYSWIFSTISQSSAAIIGIVGAFLLSKLLSREILYDELILKNKEYLHKTQILKNRFQNRHFEWLNTQKRENVFDDKEFDDYVTNTKTYNLKDILNKFNFSSYENLNELDQIISTKFKSKSQKNKNLPMSSNFALIQIENYKEINEEEEKIKQTFLDLEDHIGNLKIHIDNIKNFNRQRETFRNLLFSLLILTLIGVIYPITFMPLRPGEIPILCFSFDCIIVGISNFLKLPSSFLLISISLLFNLFFGYFLYLNSILKISEEDINNLEENTNPEAYSKYIAYKNEIAKYTFQ